MTDDWETNLNLLTDRQREVLEYMCGCLFTNNIIPTRQEIADHFGFKSANAAQDHLNALHNKKMIIIHDWGSRAVEIPHWMRLVPDDIFFVEPTKEDIEWARKELGLK